MLTALARPTVKAAGRLQKRLVIEEEGVKREQVMRTRWLPPHTTYMSRAFICFANRTVLLRIARTLYFSAQTQSVVSDARWRDTVVVDGTATPS